MILSSVVVSVTPSRVSNSDAVTPVSNKSFPYVKEATVAVVPSNLFSSAAVEVTNVSEPEVPKYNAAVLNSELDLLESAISTELAVVVPWT